MLQAALSGDRDHPATPRTPAELAAEARAAVDAGARSLHLHPYDGDGRQTLAAEPCAAALRAVRAACPGVEVSLSTSLAIEPDPAHRVALAAAWTDLPDLASVNQGEAAALALGEHLQGRGVGVEAGLLSLEDARAFVASGIASRCARALVEPLDPDPGDAVAHGAAIERTLATAGVALPQVHHGDGIASWAVNRRAIARGHGIRTGLEDTPVLPDGRMAAGNGELVAAAAALFRSDCRALGRGHSVRVPWHTTNMRSSSSQGQLILFPGAGRPARRERPRRRSRSARMAQRLDDLAVAAEREAIDARRTGDAVSARAARDRAAGARRAAELLRAGPAGVADVLGGRTEAA